MRIAYLFGSLNRGGMETLLLDVFLNAKKNQLDAIGICRKTGVLESEFVGSGLVMIKLPVQWNIISYLFRLRSQLLKSNVEVVHAQQPIDALYALLACFGTRLKVYLTFHGYDFAENKSGINIIRFIIKRTNLNIFVSETQRSYFQDKYHLNPEKQQVVYNGISFDKLVNFSTNKKVFYHQILCDQKMNESVSSIDQAIDDKSVNIHEELNIPFKTHLFGTVGNFTDVRDQLTICRFLLLLNKQNVDFHFVFIGKRIESSAWIYDDCVNYCKTNGLSKKVSFLGVRHDVPMILNEMDAFIYSTDHDTFGIALVEAMAVGIPVFVNDWTVMSEITENGKYATLYKSKDENDLLREFMLFLQNKPLYQAKAIDAAKFVRERYSIEKHIEALKAVYNELISTDNE